MAKTEVAQLSIRVYLVGFVVLMGFLWSSGLLRDRPDQREAIEVLYFLECEVTLEDPSGEPILVQEGDRVSIAVSPDGWVALRVNEAPTRLPTVRCEVTSRPLRD